MTSTLQAFLRDEEGVTMVEYGLMLALIAAVCITVVSTLGTDLQTLFTNIGTDISAA